jgi:hypothetical protein
MTNYADRLRKFNRAGQVQYEWFDKVAEHIEELEQDLALAKSALKRIGNGEFSGKMLPSMPPKDAAEFLAYQTYLAIKDEKDE